MTVNGIEMVFSKAMMMKRLEVEKRIQEVDKKSIEIMDRLNGMPVGTSAWNRQVKGEPVLTCSDGKESFDVFELDCVSKALYENTDLDSLTEEEWERIREETKALVS